MSYNKAFFVGNHTNQSTAYVLQQNPFGGHTLSLPTSHQVTLGDGAVARPYQPQSGGDPEYPPWSPGPLHHSTSGWLRKSPKSGSAKSRPGLFGGSIRRFWDSRPSVFNAAQLKNRVKPMERCDSFLSSSVCETHIIRMGNSKRGIATHVFSHVENTH